MRLLPWLTGRTRSRLAGALFLLGTWAEIAFGQTFTPFTIPAPVVGFPTGIASGSDGALWFGDVTNNAIWRLTTSGSFTLFSIPTAQASPIGLAAGSDGALWFTESTGNKIGRITTDGAITEFPLPSDTSLPTSIAAGPDGALWFTEARGRIGRIATDGTITEFLTTAPPGSITAGPDGALWFTQGDRIGRITQKGVITTFPIVSGANSAVGIASGPDGALWFTEQRGTGLSGFIGRISTDGTVTEFGVSPPGATPAAIVSGPDGALWFLEQDAGGSGMIGRITTTGAVTQFPVPGPHGRFNGITIGPDNALWFTDTSNVASHVFRLVPAPGVSPLVAAVLPSSRSGQVGESAPPERKTMTAFATIINSGARVGNSCAIAPVTGVPGEFLYQATNAATNEPLGFPNTPVMIFAGGSQTFVLSFTLSAPFTPVNAVLGFFCVDIDAASTLPGVNTLLLSASSAPVPDVVAVAATLTNDGIVHLTGSARAGAFAVATTNVGATDTITVTADTGTTALPVSLSLCQTDPATGQCIGRVDDSVTRTIGARATSTFAVFVGAARAIPSDPATNRIFVRFTDPSGITRGSASVAVQAE